MENYIKNIIIHIRSSLSLLLIFTILLGVAYPLFVTAIAQIIFHDKSKGSLIVKEDKIIGSRLLGQQFSEDKYFWGRLSANNYDAANSSGTNLSPANPKLLENANMRIEALKKADPDNKAKIPVDLITASASGLDPHISLLAAEYQISRIARSRQIAEEDIHALIISQIDWQSKIFGTPYVNVLALNLALDNLKK